jgi:hypothetical protein
MNDGPPLVLFAILAMFSIGVCLVPGCSSRDANWKETVPVTGMLTVDGKPEPNIMVTLTTIATSQAGGSAADALPSATFTDATGAFALSTYEQGDGAPLGEYVVTFSWPTMNMISMQYEGDRLDGKYNDVKTAETRIKVESGKPVDLGTIDLKTK